MKQEKKMEKLLLQQEAQEEEFEFEPSPHQPARPHGDAAEMVEDYENEETETAGDEAPVSATPTPEAGEEDSFDFVEPAPWEPDDWHDQSEDDWGNEFEATPPTANPSPADGHAMVEFYESEGGDFDDFMF